MKTPYVYYFITDCPKVENVILFQHPNMAGARTYDERVIPKAFNVKPQYFLQTGP
jgi:hypothetical protein